MSVCQQQVEPTLSEAIKNLPPELRVMIYKEYLAIKMRQRAALGWDEVHEVLLGAPFCDVRSRIVKVIKCRNCSSCGRDGLCNECLKNKVEHYLGPPWLDVDDYDEIFFEFW